MKRHKHGHWIGHWQVNEFTVLEVFFAFAAFGLLMGLLFMVMLFAVAPKPAPPVPVVYAMSDEEYEAQARAALAPFIDALPAGDGATFASVDANMAGIVQNAQDGLLGIQRIPKDQQDAHLSFVLLLDKWKRALGGSAADADDVLAKTKEVIAGTPWLTGAAEDVVPDVNAADGPQ